MGGWIASKVQSLFRRRVTSLRRGAVSTRGGTFQLEDTTFCDPPPILAPAWKWVPQILQEIEGSRTGLTDTIFVKANLTCELPIKVRYYSAKYENICYFCGTTDDLTVSESNYPFAVHVSNKIKFQLADGNVTLG